MRSKESLDFVFLSGKGSSGKDTQAEVITSQFKDVEIISTGNIYRGARTPDGEYGEFHYLLAPYIESVDKGGYFPDEIMLEIVQQIIEKNISKGKSMFVFTGFPRTVGQLEGVDCLIQKFQKEYEAKASYIYLAVLDDQSRARARVRRENAKRQGTESRPDDEADVVEKRLKTFEEKTRPMLERLAQEKRLCVVRANKEIKQVSDQLLLFLSLK